MGISEDGAGRFDSVSSSKEGDSSFKPASRINWPTIVIEAGLSESLAMLKNGAK
jgi:hypothetical protein